jgi:hypothetical protein
LVVTALLVRLVVRERITLQGSLSYLLFLGTLIAFAAFPSAAQRLANAAGFTLLSNFFFAVIAGMFALLHLSSLIAHSKAEIRTIALVQELAIMQERLDALTEASSTSVAPVHQAPIADATSSTASHSQD